MVIEPILFTLSIQSDKAGLGSLLPGKEGHNLKAMLDPELLALLVCPETHQDVALATADEVTLLNEAILLGQVRTAGGKENSQIVDGALIRQDRAVAYPIRDGIPVMLVEEGLLILQVNLNSHV